MDVSEFNTNDLEHVAFVTRERHRAIEWFLAPKFKRIGFYFFAFATETRFFPRGDSRLPICPAGLVTRVERSLLFENLNNLREIGSK